MFLFSSTATRTEEKYVAKKTVFASATEDTAGWILARQARRDGKSKPIIVKIGECIWCHRKFVYSVTNEADVGLYCRDAHRFRYKEFLKRGEKNAQVHRNYPASEPERAREQNSPSNVFSFAISWGVQPAAGTISIMEIITPTLITYFNKPKSLARYCLLFVVDELGRCLHSVFVASND